MQDLLPPLLLQIILITLNAIFASAEIAVISTNEAKLEKLSEDGNKKARKLLSLTKNPAKFLSTIQVAITLAGLLGSAYAADHFAEPLVKFIISLGILTTKENALRSVSVFLITILLSFFSIVFGELVPKRIAMKNAEKTALGMAGLLKFVSFIFAPFVFILTAVTNGILRMLHINPNDENDAMTEEEIRLMLDTGSERGTIDSMENELIQNVFEFDDISISEVCTHRRDVAILYKEDSIDEWKKIITETRHSFYPICGEDADDVIGILNIKKFFRNENMSQEAAMRAASEKAYFVPENMKADVLFQNMKETRNYFAIVIDEYGGMSGVVTIHDLLELLVGDLADKDDDYEVEIEKLDDESWRIIGSASLDAVGEALDVELNTEDIDCDTFGGYIFGLLGAVPDDGTSFDMETDDLFIHVNTVEDHRIEDTIVKKKPKISDEETIDD